jgi:4-amino-4-deoxy-L-arabinose transferase-like glycosyltransferase
MRANDGKAPAARTAVPAALLIAFHVLCWYQQPSAFLEDIDSQHYARIASELAAGRFQLSAHPFNHRFGVVLPAALGYRALGVGARQTTAWPLVVSVLTIVLVYATARRFFGTGAALFAALLVATNVTQVEQSAHLLPDLVVSFFMLAALSLLLLAREAPPVRQPLLGVLCALALAAGVLTKETVVWAAPFFAVLMVRDLRQRRHARLWAWLAGTALAALGAILLSYQLATGSALARLEAIDRIHNTRVSFAGSSRAQLLHRLTDRPLRFVIEHPGYLALVLLSLPPVVGLARPLRSVPPATRPWAAYSTIVLLGFWFGTTSLDFYNPLPISARNLMPLLAPLSILGGVTLAGLLAGNRRRAVASAAVATCAVGLLAADARNGLGAPNAMRVVERDFVNRNLGDLREPVVILTDRHSVFVLPFLAPPDARAYIRLHDWNEPWPAGTDHTRTLLYVHELSAFITHENWGWNLPALVSDPPEGWRLVDTRPIPGELGRKFPPYDEIRLYERISGGT